MNNLILLELFGYPIYASAAVITLELAARYLEDYLIGDRYFRIDYPDQNRKRAQAQLSLFRDMMLHMDDMRHIIRETMNKLGGIKEK